MVKISQKLYVRVAIAIAIVAVLGSLLTASFVYWLTLNQQRQVNTSIVNQLASSAEKTSAIAAYIDDQDLAQEIINGLVANDLVEGATIAIYGASTISAGFSSTGAVPISIPLIHPFSGDEIVGELRVVPDSKFIQSQARSIGLQNAGSLGLISLITALAVSMFVHRRLTSPLQKLTAGFKQVDPNLTDTMQPIEIGYRSKDEIGVLVSGINALMIALKQNLQTERILRERTQKLEQRFRLLFEQASAGIGLVGADNRLLIANPAFVNLFEGVEEGANFAGLFVHVNKVESTLQKMRNEVNLDQLSIDLEFSTAGQRRWIHCIFAKVSEQRLKRRIDQGSLIEVIAYDITERIERENETRFQADHDSLTQLRNRRSGEPELKRRLAESIKMESRFAIMMVDLDNFKPVNDTFGHDVGDQVLVTLSQRIRRQFDLKKDVCIRWGGDEFVFGFTVESDENDKLGAMALNLIDELRKPIEVSDSISCEVGASIGIVIAPDHGETYEQLLKVADETMYQVKNSGRGKFLIAG